MFVLFVMRSYLIEVRGLKRNRRYCCAVIKERRIL